MFMPWLLSATTAKKLAPGRARSRLQSGSSRQAASASTPSSLSAKQSHRLPPDTGAWPYDQTRRTKAAPMKSAPGINQSRPEMITDARDIGVRMPSGACDSERFLDSNVNHRGLLFAAGGG